MTVALAHVPERRVHDRDASPGGARLRVVGQGSVVAVPFVRPGAVRAAQPAELASISVLRPPGGAASLAPVRLTRRGVLALTLVVVALGAGLVWLAKAGASGAAGGAERDSGRAAAQQVTVRPGDTLWAIAGRVAPQTDPRVEVEALRARNNLADVTLTPGQVLTLP